MREEQAKAFASKTSHCCRLKVCKMVGDRKLVEYFVESVEQYAQRKKEGTLKEVVKKYLGSFEKVPIGAVDKCLGEYERVSKDRRWNPFFLLIANEINFDYANQVNPIFASPPTKVKKQ